ncbi:MAG TPA: hypothetical protein VMP01_17495 [Pirellulaceae bacterium]|nr:hypothetical protein [Pirellulaceae bacterium]
MYRSGQMELESNGWMQSRIGERPTFQASVSRGFSSQTLHVFLLPQGFLFLQKAKAAQNDDDTMRRAVVAGAAVGGLVGAMMGAALAGAANRPVEEEENFETSANDHLMSLARQRKGSFISLNDDIRSISIKAPGAFGRMFGSAAGSITIRDNRLGKITIEVKDPSSLASIVEAAPKRFGDRANVLVRWDDTKMRYVPQ